METATLRNPHETLTPEPSYDFLDTYEGYDNPDIVADLRDDILRDSIGKNTAERKQVREQKINAYILEHLDTSGMNDEERSIALQEARANLRAWVSVPRSAWEGDTDDEGNYAGNGLYDELARDIRDNPRLVITEQLTAQSHAEALHSLNNSRENLARLQTGLRHKFGWNKKSYKEQLEAAKQQYENDLINANKTGFAVLREQNPHLTQDEIKQLALYAYATEFNAMLNEQKKPEYIESRYGKTVRKLGAMSLPAKIGIGVATIGASAAVALTAGAAFGLSTLGFFGFRIGKTIVKGPVGHNTQSGTERIQKKVTEKIDEDSRRSIENTSNTITDERLAQAIGSHILASANRIDKSDRNRRKLSAAVTIATLIPGLYGTINKIQGGRELRGTIRERIEERRRVANQYDDVVGRPRTPDVTDVTEVPDNPTTPPVEAPAEVNIPAETHVEVPVQEVAAAVPPMPTAEQFANLDRLLNARGNYPWTRAMDYFHGDANQATTWIKNAAAKAGATWHNAGTRNAWIEIDGRSDVDYVWGKLTEAALRP